MDISAMREWETTATADHDGSSCFAVIAVIRGRGNINGYRLVGGGCSESSGVMREWCSKPAHWEPTAAVGREFFHNGGLCVDWCDNAGHGESITGYHHAG